MNLKFGISAKFHRKVPTFYGERIGHIQYLETDIASWLGQKGAMPLMIPSVSEISGIHQADLDPSQFAHELDALILQGGSDVHPRFYGETPALNDYPFDEERDIYELKLIEAFLNEGKPILGICRGFQLLNIYFGGTLHQDLDKKSFSGHFNKEKDRQNEHHIEIVSDSELSTIYPGTQRALVSSIHHQGVKELGKSLFVEALSEKDGLVEAFSLHGDNFVMGVQWHPELHDSKKDQRLGGVALFEAVFGAAKNRKFYGTSRPHKKRKLKFGKSGSLTLGGEIELQLVDDKSYDLKPVCPELIAEVGTQSERVKSEIFQSMLEIESGVCETALQVEGDWQREAKLVLPLAQKLGARLAGMGSHPFAKVSERLLTENPRYLKLIEKNQWIARRIAIFGLHCHIGMSSKEEAIQFYRFYMALSPLLLGLSASSAFWEGEDTGLFSVRSTFFESTPTGGHPPVLNNWQDFEGLFHKMISSGAIGSHKDLWWDLRPSIDYGTLELRICDVMPSMSQNAALIAFMHTLGLAFQEQGPKSFVWPDLSEWSYRENKWRAARYGLDFKFILKEDATTVPAKEYLTAILEYLTPAAEHMGYQDYFAILRDLVENGTVAQRHRRIFEQSKSMVEIVRHAANELEQNILQY